MRTSITKNGAGYIVWVDGREWCSAPTRQEADELRAMALGVKNPVRPIEIDYDSMLEPVAVLKSNLCVVIEESEPGITEILCLRGTSDVRPDTTALRNLSEHLLCASWDKDGGSLVFPSNEAGALLEVQKVALHLNLNLNWIRPDELMLGEQWRTA